MTNAHPIDTPPTSRPSRAWLGLSGAILVACMAGLFAYQQWADPESPSRDAAKLREAIRSAAAYLASTELRGDDSWIATQGLMKLGPRYRTWGETLSITALVEEDLQRDPLSSASGAGIEGRLWSLRWLAESPAPPLPLPEIDTNHDVSIAISEEDIQGILSLMAFTVVCPELDDSDRDAWIGELSYVSHSYRLTHQLLALMLGRSRGCIDAATAEPLRRTMAARLWAEQAADRSGLHDLSIERMAILCYAQACDWLRDDWIDELIREQEPSGSWGVRNPEVNARVIAREEHTAALGFYVLAAVWQERFGDAEPPAPPAP